MYKEGDLVVGGFPGVLAAGRRPAGGWAVPAARPAVVVPGGFCWRAPFFLCAALPPWLLLLRPPLLR